MGTQGPIPTQQTPKAGGLSSALYVNSGRPIKAGPGTLVRMNVIVAGSAGAVYDCISTADAATANEIAVVPATIGTYELNFPCLVGITYIPGASQVASFSYI